jgi:uncharacterized DUF497 family protein
MYKDTKFEWDEAKNKSNLEKHGVSFETACKIFQYPLYNKIDTRFDYGETRTISIGTIGNKTIIVVVHTDRSGRMRIISARPASQEERIIYNEKTH